MAKRDTFALMHTLRVMRNNDDIVSFLGRHDKDEENVVKRKIITQISIEVGSSTVVLRLFINKTAFLLRALSASASPPPTTTGSMRRAMSIKEFYTFNSRMT